MNFIPWSSVVERFRGKRVAIVGSGPGCVEHEPGFIDSHDIVVRANNFKTGAGQGFRTDAHYSFYGRSIRKTAAELQASGVALCMCKCPNSKPIESPWHERMRKVVGIDFRYIYASRKDFWFCDTFIPSDERFLKSFHLLKRHVPTTGFAAILDVLDCEPASIYLTGFDGFTSGIHNVNERWNPGNAQDPIGHRPDLELAWLRANKEKSPISVDRRLRLALKARARP